MPEPLTWAWRKRGSSGLLNFWNKKWGFVIIGAFVLCFPALAKPCPLYGRLKDDIINRQWGIK